MTGSVDAKDFAGRIAPFYWVTHASSFSTCLDAGLGYKAEIFEARADEGFEGGGYDWASIATVFLHESLPHLADVVRFDPEAGLFSAYSSDEEALRTFITGFKDACEEEGRLADLFSRAELD